MEAEIEAFITPADTVQTRIANIEQVVKHNLTIKFAGDVILDLVKKYTSSPWEVPNK
jgi:hypothetical protein